MDILTEIIELSNGIVKTLKDNGFFQEHIFVEELPLKRKLQQSMQRKWEQEGEMLLSDTEFIDVCNDVSAEGISTTIGDLVDKGALDMSIDENGEINYSVNENFKKNKPKDNV